MSMNVKASQINSETPSFTGGVPKLFTIKSEKSQNLIEKAGKLSTPANRFFLGATALSIQPWIDLNNKDVDEETRKMSCVRTIAKIVVGTTTGILVRMGCIGLMKKFTRTPEELKNLGKKATEYSTALIPTHISYEKFSEAKRLLQKHRNALGSFIAIAVMMITDPPLSKLLTNFLNKRRKIAEQNNVAEKGGK